MHKILERINNFVVEESDKIGISGIIKVLETLKCYNPKDDEERERKLRTNSSTPQKEDLVSGKHK